MNEGSCTDRGSEPLEPYRPELLSYLRRAFPRLGAEAEDVLQQVFLELWQRWPEASQWPGEQLRRWLYRAVRHRALDQLRGWERRAFERLCRQTDHGQASDDRYHPAQPSPGPRTAALEAERRARQGVLLSQILEEFVRWCERHPGRARIKEAYERALRGQRPGEIAVAMRMPPQRVYDLLHQARQWVYQRLQQADVHRSVFLTLQRFKDT